MRVVSNIYVWKFIVPILPSWLLQQSVANSNPPMAWDFTTTSHENLSYAGKLNSGPLLSLRLLGKISKKKQQSDFEKMSQINNTVTIKRPLAVPFTVKLDLKKFSDTKEYSSNFFSKCAGYQIIVWAFLMS